MFLTRLFEIDWQAVDCTSHCHDREIDFEANDSRLDYGNCRSLSRDFDAQTHFLTGTLPRLHLIRFGVDAHLLTKCHSKFAAAGIAHSDCNVANRKV
jgi:hypothetical protein